MQQKLIYIIAGILIGVLFSVAYYQLRTPKDTSQRPTGQSVDTLQQENNQPSPSAKKQEKNPYKDADIKIDTFHGKHGWGYDIYIDGDHYVHQPHKPAVGGKKGFQTPQSAQKVARLVKHKIQQGIMPPSVTPEDLDSLGVLN